MPIGQNVAAFSRCLLFTRIRAERECLIILAKRADIAEVQRDVRASMIVPVYTYGNAWCGFVSQLERTKPCGRILIHKTEG